MVKGVVDDVVELDPWAKDVGGGGSGCREGSRLVNPYPNPAPTPSPFPTTAPTLLMLSSVCKGERWYGEESFNEIVGVGGVFAQREPIWLVGGVMRDNWVMTVGCGRGLVVDKGSVGYGEDTALKDVGFRFFVVDRGTVG